ncbi:MAG: CapA family protein [Candidatus Limnocylindrales bacterium]
MDVAPHLRPAVALRRRAGVSRLSVAAIVVVLVAACGASTDGPSSPGAGRTDAAASPGATAGASTPVTSPASATAPPRGTTSSLAVVTGFSNYSMTSVTMAALAADLAAGSLLVPCGAEGSVAAALGATVAPTRQACVPADEIPARLDPSSVILALLPPGLVTPRVRVLPIGAADLFGETPARSFPYPLAVAVPASWPTAWTTYDPTDVRVIVTTGVNCPDRGVSRATNVLGKGWDWLLQAGTARYTGRHWDPAFGWWVVDAVRTGHAGALASLIRNADIAESDFECSMTKGFRQHDSGTIFSIDPRVAPLMAKAGFDVATIAADHNTNVGLGPVVETADLFRANGIQAVGGGKDLAAALRPAVIDVRGVKFGFVGFDAIGGSVAATTRHPGVAPLTEANARAAIAAARRAGAQVVFALPQWSSVEYRAAFTGFQRGLIAMLTRAGADHIIGADFHWAGAISITPGSASGVRFVTASQGNFWFGQDWSRQTEEGIVTVLTFVGTRLAQVRLVPTVVLDNAQPNLIDPATDGRFVLDQVLSVSTMLPR